MSVLTTYSPSDVSLVIGVLTISGYAPDTFIVVSREVENFTKTVGSDGETARRKSANKSGTITITLLQTTSDNATLSGLALIDEITSKGTFPVIIKDNSGKSIASSDDTWVMSYPDMEFANDTGNREWVLESSNINMIFGGNN